MVIREHASQLPGAIFTRGGDLETQPGECFRCSIDLLEDGAQAIRAGGVAVVSELSAVGASPLAGVMGKMMKASEIIDRRMKGS